MSIEFLDEEFKKSSLCPACRDCVGVAYKNEVIAVRNTQDSSKTTLTFTRDEWEAFIGGVKKGDFDFK